MRLMKDLGLCSSPLDSCLRYGMDSWKGWEREIEEDERRLQKIPMHLDRGLDIRRESFPKDMKDNARK